MADEDPKNCSCDELDSYKIATGVGWGMSCLCSCCCCIMMLVLITLMISMMQE
jgi:hypothetical protein